MVTAQLEELAEQTSATVARARRDEERMSESVDLRLARDLEARHRRHVAAEAAREQLVAEAARVTARGRRYRAALEQDARDRSDRLEVIDALVERCRRCGAWRLPDVMPDGSLRPLVRVLGVPVTPHACRT